MVLIMDKKFNRLEEIQKYYNKETNTYVFKENGFYIDLVVFNFNLSIDANINACDINACDINAEDINACDINTCDINARNIDAKNIDALDIIAYGDINACDINAGNIKAHNIYANDIFAFNIIANDISYYGVCVAYESIKCKSIEGRRENHKHFVLDGELEVEEDD